MLRGQLSSVNDIVGFALAGNATFTLRSKKTEERFTFKVKQAKDAQGLYFVALMNGSDNENDYQYLGTIRNGSYALGRKSRITEAAVSHKAFDWFWKHMQAQVMPSNVLECWHEGRCGKCGRKLTVPESIARGIGPECAKKG